MSPELSVITIVSSTIVSLGIFGGIVKWGISKYFDKSDALQNLKEASILKEISKVSVEIKEIKEKYSDADIKIEKLSTTVNMLVKNYESMNQNNRMVVQSNFEALEAVKKTLDKVDDLELLIHSKSDVSTRRAST